MEAGLKDKPAQWVSKGTLADVGWLARYSPCRHLDTGTSSWGSPLYKTQMNSACFSWAQKELGVTSALWVPHVKWSKQQHSQAPHAGLGTLGFGTPLSQGCLGSVWVGLEHDCTWWWEIEAHFAEGRMRPGFIFRPVVFLDFFFHCEAHI